MENIKKSDTTISSEFFNNLWTLILDPCHCNLQNFNCNEHLVPQEKFDDKWLNEQVVKKFCNEIDGNLETDKQTEIITEEEIEQLPYRGPHANILPLDQQLALVQQDVEVRCKLASDFANRKFPWYIQRPSLLRNFQITHEMKQLFSNSFEMEILQAIQNFQCHLMIIDAAAAVSFESMEGWLKFSPYVAIVTVVHEELLFEKLKIFNSNLRPILAIERAGMTWQEELQRSLDLGVGQAKDLFLVENENDAFVFVFSYKRGMRNFNKFKILKKK